MIAPASTMSGGPALTVYTDSPNRLPFSRVVPILALIKLIATLIFAGRYGYHRDEFYYIAAGHHLALGYVDFPPLTPVLAWLDRLVFGTSLVGLRLLPALAGALIVLLTAGIARELGGGPFAQVLAALAVLLAPIYLGANSVFQTVTFDQLNWALICYLAVRLLARDDARLWPVLGLALGIGLETKYTIAALAVGLTLGLLLTPARARLGTAGPWLAALIAFVLLAPNLVWQVQHGWISLSYLHTHHGKISQDTSRLSYVLEQIAYAGPLAVPLLVIGLIALFRRPRFRALAWAALVVELIFLLSGGKSYYPAPIYALLLAGGAVAFAGWVQRRRWDWVRPLAIGLLVIDGLVLLPLGLPVLPVHRMEQTKLWKVRTDYADMIGWPEMASQVARVYHGIPPSERQSTVILAGNYGEAGALQLYGPRYHLPLVISGHLTYWYWKPTHVRARTVITVGYDRASLTRLFGSITRVGTVSNHDKLHNEEYGGPIFLCRQPKISLDRAWPSLQTFD